MRVFIDTQVELRSAIMRAIPSDHVLYSDFAALRRPCCLLAATYVPTFNRDIGVLDLYQGSRRLGVLLVLPNWLVMSFADPSLHFRG